jgi:hypothetical protein
MTLVHTHNDPHGENLIERLDNIVLGEPDATIFLLPVNYKVNDMTARFEADKARSEANEFFITPEMPRPLSLAGPWEVDDPILGAATKIGILVSIYVAHQVELNQGEITSETSVRYNSPLVFQFYQRTAGVEQGIGFMAGDATPYLSASWDGQRLQAKFKDVRPSKFEHPDFALDLSFNKKQEVWTGDYTREGVTKQIRLERPGVSSKANPNPLMGAWTFPATETRGRNTRRGCLQIMQGTDGAFMAWTLSSEFGMTGRGRLPTTGTVLDNAGARWGIGIEGDMVTLDEWKYTGADAGGIGIPAKFVGKISADGTLIEGKYVQDRAAAQGQPAEEPTAVMRKTSIESCTQVTVPQRARQSRQ